MLTNSRYQLGRSAIPKVVIKPISDDLIDFLAFNLIHGDFHAHIKFPLVLFEHGTFHTVDPIDDVTSYFTNVPQNLKPFKYKNFNHWIDHYKSRHFCYLGQTKLSKEEIWLSRIQSNDCITVCPIDYSSILEYRIHSTKFAIGLMHGILHQVTLGAEKLYYRDMNKPVIRAIFTNKGVYKPDFTDWSNIDSKLNHWFIDSFNE